MYEAFYGFRESPFRVTPDPRFLYRNPAIDEAVAALTYGVQRRKGFLSLVGEVGTGKTTLLRHLLDSLPPTTQTVFILYPTVQFEEMLEHILHELGIPTDGAGKFTKLQRLHEFLLEHTRSGGNAAILLDEAQDLDARVLEELRLLSNLETGTEKILQILLAGQPEFERKLAQPALRQLRQRIALHVRLRALAPAEVSAYIRSRLQRAGAQDGALFTPDALGRVAEVTEGIPRLVNVLCDSCLVTGFAVGAKQISRPIVDEAWADYASLSAPDESPAGMGPAAPAPVASPHVPSSPIMAPEAPEPAAPPPPTVVPPAATPIPVPAADATVLTEAHGDAPPAPRRGWGVAAWLIAAASTLAAASAMWAMGPRLLALVR